MLPDIKTYCLGAVVLTCRTLLLPTALAKAWNKRRACLERYRILARVAETQKLRNLVCKRTCTKSVSSEDGDRDIQNVRRKPSSEGSSVTDMIKLEDYEALCCSL